MLNVDMHHLNSAGSCTVDTHVDQIVGILLLTNDKPTMVMEIYKLTCGATESARYHLMT